MRFADEGSSGPGVVRGHDHEDKSCPRDDAAGVSIEPVEHSLPSVRYCPGILRVFERYDDEVVDVLTPMLLPSELSGRHSAWLRSTPPSGSGSLGAFPTV